MFAFDSSLPPPHEETIKKPPHGNESYIALVWRRLKRSWTGMMGLILVGLLIIMAVFADFFAPMDPKATDVGFAQMASRCIFSAPTNLDATCFRARSSARAFRW
jgi:peptide/nickel transport system permease protein